MKVIKILSVNWKIYWQQKKTNHSSHLTAKTKKTNSVIAVSSPLIVYSSINIGVETNISRMKGEAFAAA